MGLLTEPFSQYPLTWALICLIIVIGSLVGYSLLVTIYPEFHKTDHYKFLDSLTCIELKDWIKDKESSIAEYIYVRKCV